MSTRIYVAPLTVREVAALIQKLNSLDTGDPESAHAVADDLLLDAVPPQVAEAYRRLAERCRWWAAA